MSKEIFNIINHLDARLSRNHNLELVEEREHLGSTSRYSVGLPKVPQIIKVIYYYNFHSNLSLQLSYKIRMTNNHKTQ